MKEIYLTDETKGLSPKEVNQALEALLAQFPHVKKVLIIPPDFTRCYSYAGELTRMLYEKLSPRAVFILCLLLAHIWKWIKKKKKKCLEKTFLTEPFWFTTGKPIQFLLEPFQKK